MQPDERERLLAEIAAGITRRGLRDPARIMLDVIAPLGFLAGQVALFARPLAPLGRWRAYATALGEEQSWQTLRSLVEHDS